MEATFGLDAQIKRIAPRLRSREHLVVGARRNYATALGQPCCARRATCSPRPTPALT
jgi:hypothetical protein